MQTLATALTRNVDLGIPLKEVYPTLSKSGIRFRRGQVIMVAGQPNSCKSIFAMNLALHMQVPTLYFSADTDDMTTSLRAAASLTGSPVDQVEADIKDDSGHAYYEEVLQGIENVWFCFTPEPNPEQMEVELAAFLELHGDYPELVIVDNLVNVTLDTENEWAGMRRIMKLLNYWARRTHAAVLVLHHCSEGAEYTSYDPPPRRAIQGKLSQYPSLILTLAVTADQLKIACVKNRHGIHDAEGELWVWLRIDPARMQIEEP